MTNREIAQKILEYVGRDNIKNITHCVTRIRFVLKDESRVDRKAIENLEGVMGIRDQGGQFQIVVGSKVNKIYRELSGIAPGADRGHGNEKKKSIVARVLETLSSILIPSLPPIIGGGMLKGVLYMFWQFDWIEMEDTLFIILNIMSDCMFYFYPFLLAASAAKRFKTNLYMALALAGTLMYPVIYDGVQAGESGMEVLGFLKIPYLDYSASVLPIILSVWIMSYVYNFLEDKIPEIVSVIFTPMLTLVVMVPLTLAGIAPLGYYIGEYVASGIQWLIDLSPVAAGFIVGLLRPLTVFTGTHHAVRAIVSQQLATYGYTTIGAMNYMGTMAQAAAPLALYFVIRKKNKKMKELSLSSAISGFLGVTEPALYGVIVNYKVTFAAASVGGAVGAAIASAFGAAEYGMVMSSLVTIPATIGDGFMGIVIGLPASVIVTMLIIFIFRNKVLEEDKALQSSLGQEDTQRGEIEGSSEDSKDREDNSRILTVKSPVKGVVKTLDTLPDKVFSDEVMGKGIAVRPAEGILYAPVSGTISAVFPTKHAIGVTGDNGMEILLHVGINTVNLEGKYFCTDKMQGQHIDAGEELMRFDMQKIMEAGYCCDVVILVTNSDEYLDIFPNVKAVEVHPGDTLISAVV